MDKDEITKLVDDKIDDALGRMAGAEGKIMMELLELHPNREVLEAIVARSGQWLRVLAERSDDPAERAKAAATLRFGEFVQAGLDAWEKRIAAKKGKR